MYCSICKGAPLIDILVGGNKWELLKPNRLRCGHWTTMTSFRREGINEHITFSHATLTKEEQMELYCL